MIAAATPFRIVAGAALLSLGAGLFLVGAALVTTGRATGLDPVILLWLRERLGDQGPLIVASRGVTVLGDNGTLWIVTAAGIGYWAIRRGWSRCVYLAGTTAGGAIIISAVKAVVDRPRPMVVAHLVEVRTASFPSGHAMDSAFVYGALAIAAAAGPGGGWRPLATSAAAMLLVLAIGTSRLILGVHWPTDVAAGWALGLSWTVIVARFAPTVRSGAQTPGRSGMRG